MWSVLAQVPKQWVWTEVQTTKEAVVKMLSEKWFGNPWLVTCLQPMSIVEDTQRGTGHKKSGGKLRSSKGRGGRGWLSSHA